MTGRVDVGKRKTLKQWAGYCLTGDVSKEMVMFFCGSGANGKGTFIETLQWVLGSYFHLATKDLFMESKYGTHTEELAALAGKRMVAADEVPTASKWNESLLKSVSGGGTMTLRHLYGRVFSVPIQFKVTIIGNEKPSFQGEVNEALKRRLNLVWFENVAKPRDPMLKAALRAEGPGVLRWMINGLLDLAKEPGGTTFHSRQRAGVDRRVLQRERSFSGNGWPKGSRPRAAATHRHRRFSRIGMLGATVGALPVSTKHPESSRTRWCAGVSVGTKP